MRAARRSGDNEPERCFCHGVPVAFREASDGTKVPVCSLDEAGREQLVDALEQLIPFDDEESS